MTSPSEQWLLLIIAFVANLFSAFAGGGAGLVQLPALIFLGLPFGVALATHKVASVALGIGATARHLREGSLEGRLTLAVLLWGLPGVVAGAVAVVHLPERLAEAALGLLTLGLGLYSLSRPALGLEHRPRHRDRGGMLLGGLALAGMGLLNGSLASGTGLFVTLWLVWWFGLDYRRAVAHTLVLVGLFWNGMGALALGMLAQIRWDWLPALLLGSLAGGYLGAHWAILKGNRWIKRAYEAVTLAVGLALLWP